MLERTARQADPMGSQAVSALPSLLAEVDSAALTLWSGSRHA
jgi:hypothetical protein